MHIAHIVGLDEYSKHKLYNNLPKNILVIDLDKIQHLSYNHESIHKMKNEWNELSRKIVTNKNKIKMIGGKSGSKSVKKTMENINNTNNNYNNKKRTITKNIHAQWKNKMAEYINLRLNNLYGGANDKLHTDSYNVLFVGFNIFPKDYRIKLHLPVDNLTFGEQHQKISNKILVDNHSSDFARKTINYYLKKYSKDIVEGKFPLNLLNHEYLKDKHFKFSKHYENLHYSFVPFESLLSIIKHFNNIANDTNKVINKIEQLYVVLPYKINNNIVVQTDKPVIGYIDKENAVNAYKKLNTKNKLVYLYKVDPVTFHLEANILKSTKDIKILDVSPLNLD